MDEMELDERKVKILDAIIRNYLETGEPVGSRTISKYTDLNLSSATIRNEMADLEELGYILQPHTSAGRIPSDKGYRFYVDHLMEEKNREVDDMKKFVIEHTEKVDQVLQQVAKMLAANTNYATMVSAPSYHRNKVKFIQLSNVNEEQILAVIVTEGNLVKNKIIPVSEPIDNETMLKLNILLNSNLNGLALQDINLGTIAKLKEQAGIHSDIISDVLDTVAETMGQDEDIRIYTSGTTNLFKYPELSDSTEKASELISTFEEKQQLASLVTENLLEDKSTGIQVYIGNESPIQTMKDCSVVTATYELGEGIRGTIGIVGPKHFDMNLTRAKFDELTHDLVEKTAIPVQNAMRDAGLTNADLGQVLLVGGSTRIPAVQDKVRQLTGKEPSKSLNPDECVAIGASIQGGKLAGDAGAGEILLLDVTPLSLSIETMGGIATRLIERNTTIPTKKSQIFSTAADNQTAVDINVVQGERQFARDNKSLGQFRLDGIPPARRGVPQIEVTFDIDANGIVNVSAKDLGTGKEQHITITAGSNMSDDEIDKAVREAAEYEAQDKKRKEAIDARNDADSFVFQTQQALDQVGANLDAADKSEVENDMNAVKSFLDAHQNAEEMTEADVTELKSLQEKLTQSAQKVFAKMYEQTQAAQGAAGAGPDMGNMGGAGSTGSTGAANDDVVDADFKEV